MAGRSTKANHESRVTEVFRLIIAGASRQKIIQYGSQKGWNVSNRMIDNLVLEARERMLPIIAVNRDMALAEEIEVRNDLYSLARSDKLYRTALAIADSRAKLRGCFSKSDDELINEMINRGYVVIDPNVQPKNSAEDGTSPESTAASAEGTVLDTVEAIPETDRDNIE